MANAVMAWCFLVVNLVIGQSHSVRRFIIYSLSFLICYRLQRYGFFRQTPKIGLHLSAKIC